jgi:hypothetical protein
MRTLTKQMTKAQRMSMTGEQFFQDSQNKMIDHFVRFCNQTDTAPTLANSNHVFGICDRDSKPIVAATIQILTEENMEGHLVAVELTDEQTGGNPFK